MPDRNPVGLESVDVGLGATRRGQGDVRTNLGLFDQGEETR